MSIELLELRTLHITSPIRIHLFLEINQPTEENSQPTNEGDVYNNPLSLSPWLPYSVLRRHDAMQPGEYPMAQRRQTDVHAARNNRLCKRIFEFSGLHRERCARSIRAPKKSGIEDEEGRVFMYQGKGEE